MRSFLKFVRGSVFLTLLMMSAISTTALVTTSAVVEAATEKARVSISMRAKSWRAIRGGRTFRRWSEGVRYTQKAVPGTANKCVKVVFVGGNGKVWYVRISVREKTKRNPSGYNWFPKRSLSACKRHKG